MKKARSSLTLLCLLFSYTALAVFDYEAEALLRSQPLGAFAKVKAGYGIELWQRKSPSKEFMYGYVRPELSFKTSATLNTPEARIEVFPISIFGLYAGHARSFRENDNLPTFNCAAVKCDVDLLRNFYGIKFALKMGRIFIMNDHSWTLTKEVDATGTPFADELGTLVAAPGKERLYQGLIIGGYELNNDLSVGLFSKYNRTSSFKNHSHMGLAFGQFKLKGPWDIFFGTGLFRTRQGTHHPTALGLLKWGPANGLRIF